MTDVLDKADRTFARWAWLGLQGHRCGVCGVGVAPTSSRGARWILDYDRDHSRREGDEAGPCPTGGECWDCVQGTTCRECMFHLRHFRVWQGYVPRQLVNGLNPAEWVARATAYVRADFRRLDGSDPRTSRG